MGGQGDERPDGRTMPGIVAAGFFRVIQVALLPLGAAGYVASVPRMLTYSRRAGISATLFASLYTRYMQHRLGTRPDVPAARLMAVMPNVSSNGSGWRPPPRSCDTC